MVVVEERRRACCTAAGCAAYDVRVLVPMGAGKDRLAVLVRELVVKTYA